MVLTSALGPPAPQLPLPAREVMKAELAAEKLRPWVSWMLWAGGNPHHAASHLGVGAFAHAAGISPPRHVGFECPDPRAVPELRAGDGPF